ncbi:uncharacterized protein MELLADRAFT_96115 [Melampsora larici-populina 98AG31]|uniref:Glutamate synthase central-N domain-containing protein n=1 Tax=Melampsora larici-populina (strain 98AG31 / pathotype 3-4-7) TaxID=747676 RepID=F4SB11_MELLP|nr:uncharacterized protein MELLADRAFT_96115 [Melampsora larici-populina 98AG31]EGF98167.1 hypothetical protein MELLADRAFT_96115 [Melampsora larici-populina 98AG31]
MQGFTHIGSGGRLGSTSAKKGLRCVSSDTGGLLNLQPIPDNRNLTFPGHYLRQLFAQVNNPPIDQIQESIVMSLECYVGAEAPGQSSGP